MKTAFSTEAWEDYQYWISTDKKILQRINSLIKDVQRQPYEGIGKPERLKHELAGCWSRRITHEHRMVYMIEAGQVTFIQLRHHYGD